jgi:uncharacterized protein (DUF2249 family)
MIFQNLAVLPSGAAIVPVKDHDPEPLYYQLRFEHAGQFTWDY